ncbi:zf-HC2 domain-containing protein [bacterium]|nr:zf-HC2 domain-containing protein [bacterium]
MQHPAPDILQQFADGMLDSEHRSNVEAHLHDCAECRSVVELERGISGVLQDLPLHEPSTYFDASVLNAVHAPASHRGPDRIRIFRYTAAAALILVTLVVVIVAGASGEEQSRSMLTPVFERVTPLFEQVTDFIAPATELLNNKSTRVAPDLDAQSESVVRVFFIAVLALLIFGGLERVLLPRFRHGHRH